jgi:hypothetical protein
MPPLANNRPGFWVRRAPSAPNPPPRVMSCSNTLSIDASLADLCRAMGEPGRYRLLALDDAGQPSNDLPDDMPEAHDHDDV